MKNVSVKSLLFVTIILSLSYSNIEGQVNNEYRINSDASSEYRIDTLNIEGEGLTEAEEIIYYTDKENQLKIIKNTFYGEAGSRSFEYYFTNKKFVFAREMVLKYNVPINITEEIAKEMGSEAFDSKKTKKTESQFYFRNEKLTKWVDNNNNLIDSKSDKFINKYFST